VIGEPQMRSKAEKLSADRPRNYLVPVPLDPGQSPKSDLLPEGGVFATTQWSVVLAAGHDSTSGAREALETLCRAYWFPLYAFVRRQGHAPEDAQDLTQEFFARFLEKHYLELADPARGRFRSFLLACLKNFLAEQRRHAGRLKRGGDQTLISWDAQAAEERYQSELSDQMTPEKIYERKWALALLEKTLARLGEEESAAGKTRLFAALKDFLWGERSSASYAEIGAQLEMSEGAVKVAMHRLRRHYRDLLREQVAQTVSRPEEIDQELQHLIAVIRG
jgi:RNA polymerase sigma factor (sigma-70 family)